MAKHKWNGTKRCIKCGLNRSKGEPGHVVYFMDGEEPLEIAGTCEPAAGASEDEMEPTHVFERAGLGVAPFTFVGCEHKTYQACPGAPIQPGGACAYCGTGIVVHCIIRDANGREFAVGNECVRKTGDAGLRKDQNKALTAARHAREDARIAEGVAWAAEHRDALESVCEKRGSLAEKIDWYMRNAGRSGKLRILAYARKRLESAR